MLSEAYTRYKAACDYQGPPKRKQGPTDPKPVAKPKSAAPAQSSAASQIQAAKPEASQTEVPAAAPIAAPAAKPEASKISVAKPEAPKTEVPKMSLEEAINRVGTDKWCPQGGWHDGHVAPAALPAALREQAQRLAVIDQQIFNNVLEWRASAPVAQANADDEHEDHISECSSVSDVDEGPPVTPRTGTTTSEPFGERPLRAPPGFSPLSSPRPPAHILEQKIPFKGPPPKPPDPFKWQ